MKEPVQLPQSEIQLQQRCAELERDNERLREAIRNALSNIDTGYPLSWAHIGMTKTILRKALEQK